MVLIQAAFSFFGAEVPGVAGNEVISASKVLLSLRSLFELLDFSEQGS